MLEFACLVSFSSLAYGTEPPALQVSQWLQAPAGFNGQWSSLRGKVVVLEFWATWCSPCTAAIPHLNQLANEFRDRDVVFLAVTDDDEDRLKYFLSKQPLSGSIGIDTERRSWKSFQVPGIPHTVLIDRDGSVIGTTAPEEITARILEEALAGKRPALRAREGVESDLSWDENSIAWEDGVPPSMYAIIKPIKTLTSGVWPRPAHITADGVPIGVLVQTAYETDLYHIDWQLPEDTGTYRAAFRVPEQRKERLLPYMRQTLVELFGIEARWEERERKVLVLRRIDGHAALARSQSAEGFVEMRRGKMMLRLQSVRKLCQFLTNAFDLAVVDETGLNELYDFDLPYLPGQPELTKQALKDIGMEVLKAERKIPILVVTQQPGFEKSASSEKP